MGLYNNTAETERLLTENYERYYRLAFKLMRNQDERIRRYPAGTAGAQQACVRQAESSCGGFLHRGQAQTRADFQEKARHRRWGAGGQNVCSQNICSQKVC